jgi:hypothetical protein
MAFVMVLSHSRRIFLRFFLDAHGATFIRGHAEAFAAFGGCARVVLYDNLKSAVLERRGDAIRFNPALLAFAAHYRYEPRPVAVARGNEKGRVERAIRYVRDNFFAARTYTDLDDLNVQARGWCEGAASDRPWPQDPELSVREAFHTEQAKLLTLPEREYELAERLAVTVGKTPYVRFDLNDYSVPHTHVRRALSVLADEHRVRILDGTQELACYARCWDRGQQIERAVHIEALVEHKRVARAHRASDRLAQAAPASVEFMRRAAERGEHLRATTSALTSLLDRYGARALEAAIAEAMQRGVPHPNAVRLALELAREAAGTPPPVALVLPEHVARRDAPVRAHDLASYDRTENDDDDD